MTEKDQEMQLFEILLSQFADAQRRTEYLTDKAHSLLGFVGVINSILVALIVFMVKDESAKKLLHSSPFFACISIFVVLGFSCYIISTIFALLSFRITKYKRVPSIHSLEFIQEVCAGKAKLSITHMAVQIFDGIQFTNEINRGKYDFLLVATGLLLLAIVCTAVIGILVFLSIG
ncbi:MAG: hypothetical protein HXS48_20025 [Theionarchaea archaeon]|nr:hypothetical protein [Theionarchaea archaeon]